MLRSALESSDEPWPQTAPSTIFIRHLKLLRLDCLPDWPGISPNTLSSQSNLRKRVQAVEWALYHLFSLWDVEVAKNKLQPFFPPLEPLQSSNLRAALFRLLSDLKQNGTLGRETILRKTMFDDCKGTKFEETLAELSTVVLRKVATTSAEYRLGSQALALSTSTKLGAGDRTNLMPLIITYHVSLRSLVNEKEELNSACHDLKQFLLLKANDLLMNSRRIPKPRGSDTKNLQQSVNQSWHGDSNWAATILNGTSQSFSEPLLEIGFSQIWSGVKKVQNNKNSEASSTPDLLVDLNNRLSKQRSRLQKWRDFRHSLGLNDSKIESRRTAQPHVSQDDQSPTADSHTTSTPTTPHSYKGAKLTEQHSPPQPKSPVSRSPEQVSTARSEISPATPTTDNLPDFPYTKVRNIRRSSQTLHMNEASQHRENTVSNSTPYITKTPDARTTDVARVGAPESSTEQADQISDLSEANSLGQTDTNEIVEQKKARASTLIERTRQSMLFRPAPETSSGSSASKSSRQSRFFPVNPFETPNKPAWNEDSEIAAEEGEGGGENQFGDYPDYDSVFKSRPRIATSPRYSGVIQSNEARQEEGSSLAKFESSPLANKQSRVRDQIKDEGT